MSSNGDWGDRASAEPGMADVWDALHDLPDDGVNHALDAFVASKHITIADLIRVGGKMGDDPVWGNVLAFAYPSAIKFRDLTTGRRWAYAESAYPTLKIVRSHTGEPSDTIVLCEGETDAAWLTGRLTCDVGMMGAGAKTFPAAYAAQLGSYTRVLVGLDADEAGEEGWEKIRALLPYAVRWLPEGGTDWCELTVTPELPDPSTDPVRLDVMVNARDLLELTVPEQASWLEHDVLPIGGLLLIHGWAKCFKTWLMLDLLARLSQGQDWCCLEPKEEPTKVAVVQYEVPWPYYRKRVQALRDDAREPELFDENFLTYSPLARPRLKSGNKAEEDIMLRSLVDSGAQIVAFDPIRRMMGGRNFNDEHEVRVVLDFFERVQNEGITVIATHHDNKESAKYGGGDPRGMTGSGAFSGDPDTLVSVSLPQGHRLDSSKMRNIAFTLRNAPSLGRRGFEMTGDGHPLYATEPFGPPSEDDDALADSSMPSI